MFLLIVRDKVTKQCPQTTASEEKGEPKRYRTEVLPLTSLTARPNRLSNHPPVAPLRLQTYRDTARSLGYPLA